MSGGRGGPEIEGKRESEEARREEGGREGKEERQEDRGQRDRQ
jgi:hypothetical protein